ncbi:MAG: DUF1775 domain-containing protein [Aquabacterium sp.]
MRTLRSHLPHAGLALSLLLTAPAYAHITLPNEPGQAGSVYTAHFRVGHACPDATATTGITVTLPAGFELREVPPRAGWTISTRGEQVSWTAETPQNALPQGEKTTFVLRGRLPDQPGTLWFKVKQTCDRGQADWAEVPDANRPAKPAFPAAKLEVVPAQPPAP